MTDALTDALTLRQLTKTYDNGHQALKGIDLTVAPGDFFALLGPNGAGKSTTIGIVSSLVNKTSGYVDIFGYDMDKDMVRAKCQLGVVPQEVNFNQFEKVEDVVITQAGYYGIAGREARIRSEKFLKQLGLWDKRDVQSRMLSGGMKRRLMIARALIHQPRLLILDEPTAGVDIELRRSLWEFIREINEQGTTVILTTHYLEEAEQMCRNIAIINEGEIVENTSMKELLRKLDRETFYLDVRQPLPLAMNESARFAGYQVTRLDEHTLEVEVQKQQGLNGLFRQLNDYQVDVVSMRNKANRLEELFVGMTRR
ncbi:ABC transporter ATP-binding protein [Parendozoicomonas haliclonae]|uniref:Daunorubicin/doxorubicin resistance ATP-binding protein DrrA n=1 Tax=Parendozoicomonas haliclonae TaxID=1960125 RepID=A0A1X7AMV9_9GAMM|nr:ABC transporter ATP-binding protein [Parendozoicomonas haliclonae]SMA49361.1 Daunorubicin/doxorubicin resistance ATP-binding protein DrrA [Parendozoicomonas haliclonae]